MGLKEFTSKELNQELKRRERKIMSALEKQDSSRRCPMCSQCDWDLDCPVLAKD